MTKHDNIYLIPKLILVIINIKHNSNKYNKIDKLYLFTIQYKSIA